MTLNYNAVNTSGGFGEFQGQKDMKVLVGVKRVIDYNVKIRVKPDHTGVVTENVKMSMNPFDEIAVEEAIRFKEKSIATEVILVTVGNATCEETLRHGLALGADRAILIKSDTNFESLNIAKILKAVVENENPQLVILGKQAIDNDCNQTGQMLAALLNWPQATFTSKLEIQNEKATAMREVDAGIETIQVNFPAVVTTDLRLNEPRYTSLPNIMKAKQKPLSVLNLEDLNISLKDHYEILEVMPPKQRKAGVRVESFSDLLSALKGEGLLS